MPQGRKPASKKSDGPSSKPDDPLVVVTSTGIKKEATSSPGEVEEGGGAYNDEKLQRLFSGVIQTTQELKENRDGKPAAEKRITTYWGTIEALCIEKQIPLKWKDLPRPLIEMVMSFPEKHVMGNGKMETIEANHYLIRQIRIPTEKEGSLQELLRVAFNIGLWKANPNPLIYKDIEFEYDSTKLSVLNRYLKTAEIKRISKELASSTYNSLYQRLEKVLEKNSTMMTS
jgi:hypothetical protein